jgi:Ser/Thr protein kinase RdoA (MazF antagonist)
MHLGTVITGIEESFKSSRSGLKDTQSAVKPTVKAKTFLVAEKFSAGQKVNTVTPLGNGLINDTFLVSATHKSFVLQRINAKVFPKPREVIDNFWQLSRHIRQKPSGLVRLQIPELLSSQLGQSYYEDAEGQLWRALQLIQPAESRERLDNDEEAAQVGFALAHFHHICSDLSATLLHDTLPGFHITPLYFQHYQTLLATTSAQKDAEFLHCQDFIQARRSTLDILDTAQQSGLLKERVIHGDPKLNNFLFFPGTHQIVSLIDLDTVKPGLVHYDIGDCVRSCCHNKHDDSLDIKRCEIILRHYLQEAGEFFSGHDYDYLYAAIWLIPFELGLRFFSDYLSGDQYFKTTSPRQNLKRALSQFALCQNIEQQKPALKHFIDALKSSAKTQPD